MGFKNTKNEDYICQKIGKVKTKHKIGIFGLKKCMLKENTYNCFSENSLEMVKKLSKNYMIVVIASYLRSKEESIDSYITKITKKLDEYDVPMVLLCSLKHNRYELPLLGFWDLIRLNIETKRENCFYVGTRAGRVEDDSNVDYKFALNCGIDFYTPSLMFNNFRCRYHIPKKVTLTDDKIKRNPPKINDPKIVLIMGYPCSGKSKIAEKHFSDCENNINVDGIIIDCKFYDKLKKLAMKNESVVIEGSFQNKGLRNGLVEFAKSFRYNTQCIRTNVDYKLARHLNVLRMLNGEKLIKNKYFKYYQQFYEEPSSVEGWDDIYLYTDKFKFDEGQKKQFNLYLY